MYIYRIYRNCVLRIIYIVSIIILAASPAFTQRIESEFGKNRIQYHDDFNSWRMYETENFITYWYGKAQNIAIPTFQIAEKYHDEIQDIMEHRMNDKIQIIVYTDISDFKQSNIGLEDIFTSEDKMTKVVGNKMFIYFKGDHQQLVRDVRQGIARVYLNEMIHGSSIRERVQNAIQLDLPPWYTDGIVAFAGQEWDYLLDDELRDIFHNPELNKDFYRLSELLPRISGHAFWYYISSTYGTSTIANILYLTKLTRNIDEAMLYVLNIEMDQLAKDWESYFRSRYDAEQGSYNEDATHLIDVKKKADVPVSRLSYSSDADYLAIAQNEIGRVHIKIMDRSTGDVKTIYRYGSKNNVQATDYNYPQLVWHPEKPELTFTAEKKDKIYLYRYDLNNEELIEQLLPTAFYRVYSIDYLDDFTYVFTADTDGFSDLYTYEVRNRTWERISNDFYDDLDASVVDFAGSRGILFASNRLNNHLRPLSYDTIVPLDNFNIFFYDLSIEGKNLLRLTDTPDRSERHPIAISEREVVFLTETNGIKNAHRYSLSDNAAHPITNKSRNIIAHDIHQGTYAYTYYYEGDYDVYEENIAVDDRSYPPLTSYRSAETEVVIPLKPKVTETDTLKPGYMFQSEFEDPEYLEDYEVENRVIEYVDPIILHNIKEESKETTPEYVRTDVVPARLRFRVADFVTRMDNDLLFEGLESYTQNDRSIFNPMGLLLKAQVLDLFEDYKIEGGARFPLNLSGSEYFLTFEDRKNRIDKKYAIYRRSKNHNLSLNTFPLEREKNVTLLGQVQFSYPFSVYRSVRLTTTLRSDQRFELSSDAASFNSPINDEKRFSVRMEYVFDNTIDYAVNIKHGTRYKLYAEGINEFNIELIDDPEFKLSQGLTGIIGVDARHYIQVLKYSVFASRFAGATSFGSKKNLFYLGGVNNNILDRYNDNIPVSTDEQFAYQTNAFHLRGFDSNIRNGSSYALVNTELRVPVLRYIFNPYKLSSFFKNLQLVGFFDAGLAWYGWTPYDDKNPLNIVTVERPPVVFVKAKYYRDPLVMGFGGGLRINLLGYQVRLDVARGIDTRELGKPTFHVSIGKDF